ncbi:MAG: hypothetical protein H6Q90_6248 [Deltaproteobacteria bacterium]|nr:hypothetical protein [Deltaproteobacteria bacterium]
MKLAFTPASGGGRGAWLTFAAILLVGATIMDAVLDTPDAARTAETPPRSTVTSTQPVLMEPPGGPIIWGVTSAGATIALDGTAQRLRHAGGTGAMIRFLIQPGCAGGDLEVVRTAPGPRTVTHRDVEPTPMAYVPDGSYLLTPVCGHARRSTTRFEISSVAP